MWFVAFLSVWFGGNAYLGWRLIGPSGLPPAVRTAGWIALAVLAVHLPVSFFAARRLKPSRLTHGLRLPAFHWISAVGLAVPVVAARDLGWLGWLGLARAGLAPPPPPDALRLSGALIGVLVPTLMGIGWVQATRTPRVKRVTIPLPGLPPALDGFRIVQLTDLHAGPTVSAEFIANVVEVTNGLRPDLVAVTGDLADGDPLEIEPRLAPLRALASRHGAFYVTGNHDYYHAPDRWLPAIPRFGLTLVDHAHAVLDHDGARVLVAGVPDPAAAETGHGDEPDPARARRDAPAADVSVLLCHRPDDAPAAAAAGYDLQLSGHTHGGQFFPWKLVTPRVFRHPWGRHRVGRMWLYVSRGTGYWGPPNRLGVPSEITLLELRRAEV